MKKQLILVITTILVGCAAVSCSSTTENTGKNLFPTVKIGKIGKTGYVFKKSDPFFRKPCQQ